MICSCSSLDLWMLDSAPALVVMIISLKPKRVLLGFFHQIPTWSAELTLLYPVRALQ